MGSHQSNDRIYTYKLSGRPYLTVYDANVYFDLYNVCCQSDFVTVLTGCSSSSSRGTCTCTCETRPVSASDTKSNSMPTSAALIRTAARKDASRGQHEAAVVDGKKPEKVTPATGTASEQPTDTTSDHQYVEAPSLDDVSESQSPASSELMQLLSRCVDLTYILFN